MSRRPGLFVATTIAACLGGKDSGTAQVRTSTPGETTRTTQATPKPSGPELGPAPQPTAVSSTQRLEVHLPPFELVGIYYILNHETIPGYQIVRATRISPGNWALPVSDVGSPDNLKFLWKFRGETLARDTLDKAIQTHCCLSVHRWETPLGGGFSWAGKDTVRSTVGIGASASMSWPQDFHLQALYPWSGVPSTSKAEKVWRGPIKSYFEREIYPIFRSERCSTCHKMGDGQAIVDQHNSGQAFKGYSRGVFPYSAAGVKPDVTEPCTDCHIEKWKSPAFSKGINWKEKKDAKEICQTVNARLPTKEQKHAHFHDDPRLKWAVSDGRVFGYSHAVAPPGDFTKFLTIIDRWIDAGAPCPQ